ncbi:NAD(+)/NADH kinase [Candidatus Woesearchaeota archaeon]|nr:NAD(+)/NADH kinase [Candidatus Woesearchaeota archaeon]
MKPKSALVVCYKDNYGTETAVNNSLNRYGIKHSCINRDVLDAEKLRNADLIITVGGDGTFLRTAQYVKDQPVLSVASSLEKNEGFFARAIKEDFEKKMGMILRDEFSIINLNRLQSEIAYSSGEKAVLEPAVNEVFVGSRKPYITFRYMLKIGKDEELQKSSGVIISTGAGSTAWSRSAGGKKLEMTSKKMQYVVREPYFGRLTQPKMTQGVLDEPSSIRIKSESWDGIVAIDSHHHEHDFSNGAVLVVKKSGTPLRFISF